MDAAAAPGLVNLDALIKRVFPGIACGMIAAAAYLQASGWSSILREVWRVEGAAGARPGSRPTAAPEPEEHATSAAPILSRNPFDSITGPLDPAARPPAAEPAAPAEGDPYEDPECDASRVLVIIDADDPAYAFAAISSAGNRAQLRRTGDAVGDSKVHAIAWDRVWLAGPGARCQLRLGTKPPAARAPAPPAAPARKAARGALPAEIAAKIQKISDREFNVDRTALDSILERQAELMRSTRARPVKQGDKVVGMSLLRVPENSLLASLGLKKGDQVQSINGFNLADPQKALEAYARLRTASDLMVALQRGGQPMTIDIHIR